ncbi:MAG: 50S ribosomal protein L9 [Nitrospinaceae bacterium]|nr:50S ribosomal protein L9 [Nitrospinaceae bacterium]NIR55071.1 50S ribosomal protein L9 [Nitrospinaceae bacterium]NIS85480.1 50S ribosomal protein L9 [Nitrospinaceae bacterium]NIT82318.1 50S ribosomal protein L9 [Nitrospinaceae bacterium]NIU44536.1 50S ribosomal protein L9 [Nitrospinaceae bacterium]
MKILLKEDVPKLGSVGDEVTVKDGYGRNYLIPSGKAIVATPKNLKQFRHQKNIVDHKVRKLRGAAQEVADKLAQSPISITKKVGEQGKLFGSVTSQEIAELVAAKGVEIDRRKIQLSEPIKSLGEFKIPVKLHPEVTAEIQLTVAGEAVVEEAAEPAEAAEAAPEAPEGEAPAENPVDESGDKPE